MSDWSAPLPLGTTFSRAREYHVTWQARSAAALGPMLTEMRRHGVVPSGHLRAISGSGPYRQAATFLPYDGVVRRRATIRDLVGSMQAVPAARGQSARVIVRSRPVSSAGSSLAVSLGAAANAAGLGSLGNEDETDGAGSGPTSLPEAVSVGAHRAGRAVAQAASDVGETLGSVGDAVESGVHDTLRTVRFVAIGVAAAAVAYVLWDTGALRKVAGKRKG